MGCESRNQVNWEEYIRIGDDMGCDFLEVYLHVAEVCPMQSISAKCVGQVGHFAR
jgi:hypothetical protein